MLAMAYSVRTNGFQIKIGIILTSLLFYLSITNIMSIDTNKLDTHAGRAGKDIKQNTHAGRAGVRH